jgi:DNA-directed RNA polymerase specialized sigma24 family protein
MDKFVNFSPWGHVIKYPSTHGTTMMYVSRSTPNHEPWLISSPFAAPTLRDEAPQRFKELLSDPIAPPDTFYVFIVLHPACERITELVVNKRFKGSGLDSDADDDLRQDFKLRLWSLFQRQPDLRTWLSQACPHFSGWVYKLNMHLGSREFRALYHATFGTDEFTWEALGNGQQGLESQADPYDSFAALELHFDVAGKLSDLPARTQQVFFLQQAGYTLEEIAQELGINRDAVRWALTPWREVIQDRMRVFLCEESDISQSA